MLKIVSRRVCRRTTQNYLILILGGASADASADMSAVIYLEFGTKMDEFVFLLNFHDPWMGIEGQTSTLDQGLDGTVHLNALPHYFEQLILFLKNFVFDQFKQCQIKWMGRMVVVLVCHKHCQKVTPEYIEPCILPIFQLPR